MYATKISGDTTNTLNCYFLKKKKITLWHIRLNINIWKTKFSSHKQYLFDLLLPRTAKKTHTDQSIYKLSCTVWKKKSHKPLKVAAAKKSFPSLCTIETTCFNECFYCMWSLEFFIQITFYTNLSLPRVLVQPPCCYVLWSKCSLKQERNLHFVSVYPHNNITILLTPTVKKNYFLNALNKMYLLIVSFTFLD